MLSLSKPVVSFVEPYERTLQVVNTLSNPDSFFEWFFNPYPSTSSGRTDWKGVLQTRLLRQAQDRQGKRIEKRASDKHLSSHSERSKADSGKKSAFIPVFPPPRRRKTGCSQPLHGKGA
ncbi:MAG: hypothetical protein LBD67_04755 [Candidatus Accumulibacter sp.]|nr:hypothetical protein [Accumulibacter sp.]